MINILIVDDHVLVRMGMRKLLEGFADMQVVAEAANGEDALNLIRTVKPDVVLLDMKMPGIDGWEVIRRLKKSQPEVKIIALTAICVDSLPTRVLQLGAMGYLTKDSGIEEMAAAIRKVAAGDRYLSAEIAQKMAIDSLNDNSLSPFDCLSKREMQVMMMIARGMTVQEICDKLFLSSKTVNCYRYRTFEKLSIKNDVELTWLAIQHNIIEMPGDYAGTANP